VTSIDPADFLHSLATVMAAAASVNYASGSPRGLWIWQAVEDAGGAGVAAADPYSVLSIFSGSPQGWGLLPRVNVQCKTVGSNRGAAALAAMKLYEALLDTDGYPWRMRRIAGLTVAGTADGHWRVVSADSQGRPGMIGVDDRNRAEVVFNFEVGFFKEAS
jgi:hypothetical protein